MKTYLAASLGLIAISAFAAEPVIHRDLPYSEPRNESQLLDIYAPAEGSHHPVIVWIHGGGWMRGDKADLQLGATDPVNRKPHAFVAKGYVFVSINYRMEPVVALPEIAGDIAKAIRWVHRHAAEYGGDPASIFVMGHSAGAQMAALVCTDRGFLDAEGLTLADIKGCVPVDGDTYDPELALDLEPSVSTKNAQLLDFPDLRSQKTLSAIQHIFKGKSIPPSSSSMWRTSSRDPYGVAVPRPRPGSAASGTRPSRSWPVRGKP